MSRKIFAGNKIFRNKQISGLVPGTSGTTGNGLCFCLCFVICGREASVMRIEWPLDGRAGIAGRLMGRAAARLSFEEPRKGWWVGPARRWSEDGSQDMFRVFATATPECPGAGRLSEWSPAGTPRMGGRGRPVSAGLVHSGHASRPRDWTRPRLLGVRPFAVKYVHGVEIEV